jgi:hypothetical protein
MNKMKVPHIYDIPRVMSSSYSSFESLNSFCIVDNESKQPIEYKEQEGIRFTIIDNLTRTKRRRIASLISCFVCVFILVIGVVLGVYFGIVLASFVI